MKTSLINWIPIAERQPQDLAYVLGAFKSSVNAQILVFAMFYHAEEQLFRDADDVMRGADTAEPILYWAPMPLFPDQD